MTIGAAGPGGGGMFGAVQLSAADLQEKLELAQLVTETLGSSSSSCRTSGFCYVVEALAVGCWFLAVQASARCADASTVWGDEYAAFAERAELGGDSGR